METTVKLYPRSDTSNDLSTNVVRLRFDGVGNVFMTLVDKYGNERLIKFKFDDFTKLTRIIDALE